MPSNDRPSPKLFGLLKVRRFAKLRTSHNLKKFAIEKRNRKKAAAAAAQYVLKLKHDSIWSETCITISHVGHTFASHIKVQIQSAIWRQGWKPTCRSSSTLLPVLRYTITIDWSWPTWTDWISQSCLSTLDDVESYVNHKTKNQKKKTLNIHTKLVYSLSLGSLLSTQKFYNTRGTRPISLRLN